MMMGDGFAAMFAVLGSFIATFGIIILALIIFLVVAKWKMFVKAGKPGWASIIPIYSTIVTLEIIGYKWYYIFFYLLSGIPLVGQAALIIFTISVNIKLAKSFGQKTAFGIGLWLVNPIFTAIIAFSNEINYVAPVVDGDIDFRDLF